MKELTDETTTAAPSPAGVDDDAWSLFRLSLPTRVGRSILLVFVGCALIPIVLLALMSDRQLSTSLDEQARAQLSVSARNVATGVADRLELVANLLIARATLLATLRDAESEDVLLGEPPPGWLSLELTTGLPVGEGETISHAQLVHLQNGHPLLWTGGESGNLWIGVKVLGVRSRTLWGLLYPEFLWGKEGRSTVMLSVASCVLTDRGQPLGCQRVPPSTSLADVRGREAFLWEANDTSYVAAAWPIDLRAALGAEPWHVVVSETTERIYAPARAFRLWFFGIGGLAIVLVVYMSARLIRRNMAPLARLQEAIQHIAERNFAHRVEIRSVGKDEFRDLAESFNGMAEELGRHARTLTAIHAIDRAVLSTLDRNEIIEAVLERGEELLPMDVLGVGLTRGEGSARAWSLSARRRGVPDVAAADLLVSEAELKELSLHGNSLTVPQPAGRTYLAVGPLREGLRTYHIVPIKVVDRIEGVLVLGFRDPTSLDSTDRTRARQLADRIAVAISNTRLVEELGSLHWGTLTALARAIDAKSPWTAGHSERVTALGHALGQRMGLPQDELDRLHRGGLLHDVGKIGIPAEILDKPDALTEHERMVMETHPVIGVRILAPIGAYADVLDVVRHHHERWDGAGYPDRVGGTDIPLLARVLAVADVYDAVTSARPYRPGWSRDEALALIRNGAGSAFDPDIVPVFVSMIEEEDAPAALPTRRASGSLHHVMGGNASSLRSASVAG